MKFDTIEVLKEAGFSGFKPAAALRRTELSEVPDAPGVYLVVRDPEKTPVFASKSSGGHFRGRDPTVDSATLEANWVEGSSTLYIGKAGGGTSTNTLRKRLKTFLRFGAGEPVAHWGGRLIWQLQEVDSLLFCWRTTGTADAREVERQLLQEFIHAYQRRPFANLQN